MDVTCAKVVPLKSTNTYNNSFYCCYKFKVVLNVLQNRLNVNYFKMISIYFIKVEVRPSYRIGMLSCVYSLLL